MTDSKSLQDILETIKSLSVKELNDLVKMIEEEFGVSAAAFAVAGGGAAVAGDAGGDEKTEFNVHLIEVGANKMGVIKAVKEIAGLTLKDAKEKVDKFPSVIKEGVATDEAKEMKKKLEEAGAKVELK